MATTPPTGIDWTIVTNIAGPLLGVVVGAWVTHVMTQKPKLVSFFGHVSTFRAAPPNVPQPFLVYTHTIVLRNTGRSAATNIRLTHRTLPDFNIFPPLQHHIEDLPGGARDIVIPRLVAGQQIVLSYIYLPPLTAGDVHAGVNCDQGPAREIPVLLQRIAPKWFVRIILATHVIGVATVLYLAWVTGSWAWHHANP